MLERIGVLCLGVFVGYLLAVGLQSSKPSLRAVLTVLGASLGGLPVAFLAQADSKWAYPLGLLCGFMALRLFGLLRSHGLLATIGPSSLSAAPTPRVYAESGSLLLALVAVSLLALFTPFRTTQTERGTPQMNGGEGNRTVRYAIPFKHNPHISIIPHEYITFRIEGESPEGFVFVPLGHSGSAWVEWEARGEERR